MASTAKPVSLHVRPLRAVQLCFETDGILAEPAVGVQTAQLGQTVTAFDFAAFHATLGGIPTNPGDPSRIKYDFLDIQGFTKTNALAALRAEPAKAALHKAINARQNAFLGKYGHIPEIVKRMTSTYSPGIADTKPVRLEILSSLAQTQYTELQNAYLADKRTGVVRNTTSQIFSTTYSWGSATETGENDSSSLSSSVSTADKLPNLPSGGGSMSGWGFHGDLPISESISEATSGSETSTTGAARQTETINNTDYAYRTPYLENASQLHRAQISLMDEQFNLFMSTLNMPQLGLSLLNELNSIDADVFRLQIAYLNTILLSPITGIVTGLYKQPGDAVRAGEPVYRVEDATTILLTGVVTCRAPIALGSTMTVTTPAFDGGGAPVTITGPVVAVRGRPEGDDKWEVVAQCPNMAGLPLGYHFDYDDTVVSFA